MKKKLTLKEKDKLKREKIIREAKDTTGVPPQHLRNSTPGYVGSGAIPTDISEPKRAKKEEQEEE